jgi:hypothetical protein
VSERAQIPEQRRHGLGVDVGEKEPPQRRLQVKPDVNFLLADGGPSIAWPVGYVGHQTSSCIAEQIGGSLFEWRTVEAGAKAAVGS